MKPFKREKVMRPMPDGTMVEWDGMEINVSPYQTDEMPRGWTEGCWYNTKEIEALEKRVQDLEEIITILVEKLNKVK